jgi:hypothetical protein
MSDVKRILDLAGVKNNIAEDSDDDVISVFIKANISYFIANLNDVEGYEETHSEKHGHEVYWSDNWERDQLRNLGTSKVQLETTVGIFDIIDFDLQTRHLSHGSGGVWYDGDVEFWVDIPREIAKSKEHLQEIIGNSRLLIFKQGQNEPDTVKPESLQIYDYDFSGEFTESLNW